MSKNLIFSDDFLLCYDIMRMANTIVNIWEVGYWYNFDKVSSATSNVWKIYGYGLKYPDKTNRKILDFIIITERVMELTKEEPQFEQIYFNLSLNWNHQQ